jgi:hypothetical protein
MSLNSANGTSSLMNNTEDSDVIELQNRLQFTKNTQVSFIKYRIFCLSKGSFNFSLLY